MNLERLLPRLAGAWSCFDFVQLRAKGVGAAGYVEALVRLREAVAADGPDGRPSRLLANDRLDVALAAGADGVHVGESDLTPEAIRSAGVPPGFVVGLTCHTEDELRQASGRGVDYAGVGTFYPSVTKPAPVEDPRPALRALPADFSLPLYAIGGLTLERVPEALSHPHVTGVVTSSAIQHAADPALEARAWRDLLDGLSAEADGRR